MWGYSSKTARIVSWAIGLATPATTQAAAQWRVANLTVSDQVRTVTFVDLGSLTKKGERISFKSVEYKERPSGGYDRVLSSNSANCETMKLSVVRSTYYWGTNLVGFSTTPQESDNYSEQSAGHWLIRHACESKFLSELVGDPQLRASQMFSADWKPVAEDFAFDQIGLETPSPLAALSGHSKDILTASR